MVEPARWSNLQFLHGLDVRVGFPDHPTLAAIAEREREIAHRQAMDIGGHRLAARLTVALSAAAVAAGITAALVAPLVFVVAILLAAMAGYCGRIWWIDPPIPTPQPLRIQPYSAAENRLLMARQAWEPFFTYSTCPGCGHLDAHSILPSGRGAVMRQCVLCAREWAQG